jgi:P-type E1-E2 ATPase
LHSQVRHRCVVVRGGHAQSADVTGLVPGDVVDLQLGEVVPADLRLIATAGLECDESVLTGESLLRLLTVTRLVEAFNVYARVDDAARRVRQSAPANAAAASPAVMSPHHDVRFALSAGVIIRSGEHSH